MRTVVITAWGPNINLPDWGMITRKALEIRKAFGPMSDKDLCDTMEYLNIMVSLWSDYLYGKDDMDLSHLADMGIATRAQALDFIESPDVFGNTDGTYEITFNRATRQIFLSQMDNEDTSHAYL